MRDIEKYTEDYLEKGFEDWQVRYRRRKVLEILGRFPHCRILEIGCGTEPLFLWMDTNAITSYTVCEPSKKFYENAIDLAKGKNNVNVLNRPFAASDEFVEMNFDFILCSGLLHEVENPIVLLQEIRKVCCQDTVVHINVPNANSFHRLLAKNMGLIHDVRDFSERNVTFQQHNVFTIDRLRSIVEETDFRVLESGSYFMKPFTHDQMYAMLQQGIINERVLDGLYVMSDSVMNGIGSEIFVNVTVNMEE